MKKREPETFRGWSRGPNPKGMVGLGTPDETAEIENQPSTAKNTKPPRKTRDKQKTPAGHNVTAGVNWFARLFAV